MDHLSYIITILLVIVVILISYIRYKKYKTDTVIKELQLLVNNYILEISQIKERNNNAENHISELNAIIKDYKVQLENMNQADIVSKQEIRFLNKRIEELMEQESPKFIRGKLLYDKILQNGTTVEWTNDDYNCFVYFYKTTNLASYSKVIAQYSPKTAHNTFFLLLYEIGKQDKDIRKIMGITQEAIRSTRFRIQKNLRNK